MVEAYQASAVYLWAALLAIVLAMALWVITLQVRVKHLVERSDRLLGDTSGNLEDAVFHYVERLDQATARVESLDQLCREVAGSLRGTLQRVGVVRFNPFPDTGGDQSFAVALLDADGNGVVFSSLFGRATARIFAKAIVAGQSSHLLTDEERDAIDQAMSTRAAVG